VPARLRLVVLTLSACAATAVLALSLAGQRGSDVRASPEPAAFQGSRRPPAVPPVPFDLRDQDGRRVSSAALRGRPVVLAFLYSSCEDTCPLQAQAVRGALDRLEADVDAFAISVDPAGDTPARARRFLLRQRLTGRMRFLLGSRSELAPVWRGFGIRPRRGELEHSAYTVLLDRAGVQRLGFPGGGEAGAIAADLRRLGA